MSGEKVLTCLIKDDFSNFVLLYRKLAATDYDIIGIQTSYDRKNQRFILIQELTKTFPLIACLGPVPVYEDYITMANFPYHINLNHYNNNVINIDMMEHLKKRHIDNIFPVQKTVYHPKLNVDIDIFNKTKESMNLKEINIGINWFDPMYDADFSIRFGILAAINEITATFKEKVNVFTLGVVAVSHAKRIQEVAEMSISKVNNLEIIPMAGESLSAQISTMLHLDYFISGSYGLGFLAYMIKVPSMIIFPFHMTTLVGRTIDPNRKTPWYMEVEDIAMEIEIGKIIEFIKNKKAL